MLASAATQPIFARTVPESGHWYKRDGSPCYEVPTKDGRMRGINLAWDRKLELVPSVTTILQVAPKPQLEVWKQNQMILAALTLPRIEGEPEADFLRRVREDAFKGANDAADLGTQIHDACEQHYKGRDVPEQFRPHVAGVAAEVARLFPHVNDWVSEAYFAHPSGFGGKVDLHSPSAGIVVDFKGKDGDFTDGKKLAYDQHYQLAAYNRGLRLQPAACANVFFSRTHPGAVSGHVWAQAQVDEGWEFFERALALWKCWKRYDGAF